MEKDMTLAMKLRGETGGFVRLYFAIGAFALLSSSLCQADNFGPNVIPAGNFESVKPTYIPWAGVDDAGNIHCIDGKQLSVGDNGAIGGYSFGPGVAAADLNGDGKPDLVVADSKGYFWFFPNSGTPQKPAFTQGEVIPIWLGEDRLQRWTEGVDNIVSRIQLLSLSNSNKLDILAGTFSGKLYHIPNAGSSAQPSFKPTYDRDPLLINTHRKGVLWCNYMAPVLTGAFGNGNILDLVMGEGTYSANSIYLLHNTNSGGPPMFDEDHIDKIIPGMGLEQLTPAVVDWNNDGKPDIICGDRTGYLTLYLNNSSDTSHPTFAQGTRLSIGGVQKFGGATTVSIADLTGNHLPNLLIGRDDGTILYATNTGKLGSPSFITPATPLKGVLPVTYHYYSLNFWSKQQAYGAPYELVGAVNPQIEPGFSFPQGVNSKYALKFWVVPVKNTYFPEHYYPKLENEWIEHNISCSQRFNLDLNKRYRVHFWIKSDKTLSDLHYKFWAAPTNRVGFHGYDVANTFDCSSSWTEVNSEITISNPSDPTIKTWNYSFNLAFQGQATVYVDDLQISPELN